MLFDIQGKRKRVVQATYLTLALLMGGGLVLFGIGGDVSGGLFDAFSDRGGGSGSAVIQDRIDRNEEKVAANPKAAAAIRKQLVRDYYSLAASESTTSTGFSSDVQDELRGAADNWAAYLRLKPERVDPSLARLALQLFDPTALDRPKQAQEAARAIAESENDTQSYLLLVQYATLAGDSRTAGLAGKKAVDLAPANSRKAAAKAVKQAEASALAASATGDQTSTVPAQP